MQVKPHQEIMPEFLFSGVTNLQSCLGKQRKPGLQLALSSEAKKWKSVVYQRDSGRLTLH